MTDSMTLFTKWFAEHRNGRANDELTAKFNEAVNASRNLEKPAEVTVKLKIKPSGGGRQVIVIDDITSKIPEVDREVAIYYADRVGNVTKDDPMQERLDLQSLAPDGSGTIHLHREDEALTPLPDERD